MTEEERKELRQQIGMFFQGSALFDSMTVEQKCNISVGYVHQLGS